jgi:hypothetical protein
MRLPSRENATDLTELECPSKTYWMAGQAFALPISTERVRGKYGEYCLDTSDVAGANGSADI